MTQQINFPQMSQEERECRHSLQAQEARSILLNAFEIFFECTIATKVFKIRRIRQYTRHV